MLLKKILSSKLEELFKTNSTYIFVNHIYTEYILGNTILHAPKKQDHLTSFTIKNNEKINKIKLLCREKNHKAMETILINILKKNNPVEQLFLLYHICELDQKTDNDDFIVEILTKQIKNNELLDKHAFVLIQVFLAKIRTNNSASTEDIIYILNKYIKILSKQKPKTANKLDEIAYKKVIFFSYIYLSFLYSREQEFENNDTLKKNILSHKENSIKINCLKLFSFIPNDLLFNNKETEFNIDFLFEFIKRINSTLINLQNKLKLNMNYIPTDNNEYNLTYIKQEYPSLIDNILKLKYFHKESLNKNIVANHILNQNTPAYDRNSDFVNYASTFRYITLSARLICMILNETKNNIVFTSQQSGPGIEIKQLTDLLVFIANLDEHPKLDKLILPIKYIAKPQSENLDKIKKLTKTKKNINKKQKLIDINDSIHAATEKTPVDSNDFAIEKLIFNKNSLRIINEPLTININEDANHPLSKLIKSFELVKNQNQENLTITFQFADLSLAGTLSPNGNLFFDNIENELGQQIIIQLNYFALFIINSNINPKLKDKNSRKEREQFIADNIVYTKEEKNKILFEQNLIGDKKYVILDGTQANPFDYTYYVFLGTNSEGKKIFKPLISNEEIALYSKTYDLYKYYRVPLFIKHMRIHNNGETSEAKVQRIEEYIKWRLIETDQLPERESEQKNEIENYALKIHLQEIHDPYLEVSDQESYKPYQLKFAANKLSIINPHTLQKETIQRPTTFTHPFIKWFKTHENTNLENTLINTTEIIPENNQIEITKKEPTTKNSPVQKIELEEVLKTQKENKETGDIGEKLVYEYEKKRLLDNGRADLAEKVEHSAMVRGDGLGYDIKSYNSDGSIKYIEVKTTKSPYYNTDFELTKNEYEFALANASAYEIYRIYNLNKEKHSGLLYIITCKELGDMNIEPIKYRVHLN